MQVERIQIRGSELIVVKQANTTLFLLQDFVSSAKSHELFHLSLVKILSATDP